MKTLKELKRYESDELKSLTPEEQRITWMTYNSFARNGATLDDSEKAMLKLTKNLLLHTKFSNNVLADEETTLLYY